MKQSDIYDQLEMSKTGFWKILKGKVNPNRLTVFALAIENGEHFSDGAIVDAYDSVVLINLLRRLKQLVC